MLGQGKSILENQFVWINGIPTIHEGVFRAWYHWWNAVFQMFTGCVLDGVSNVHGHVKTIHGV